MELIGLDAQFAPVGALRCLNIQWNRRYHEAGDYMLQMRAADFDDTVRFVYAADRPETGMVEKVETEHGVKGDFVIVSGFFLEGMLNWKAAYPRYTVSGNVADACRALVAAYLADTGVTVGEGEALAGDGVVDTLGEPLGDVTYAALRLVRMGQRVLLDYVSGELRYEVWRGLDRTQSQTENPYAVFSQHFGTVDALTLTRDTSSLRNYAVALYDGGAVTVDARGGEATPARMLVLDTGLSLNEWATQAQLTAAAEAAARAELALYPTVLNLDATVLQNHLKYRTDYDLGDLCDVRDDRLRMAFEARIIEVNEVWKDGAQTVSLQFGEKIPAAYRR